MFNLGENLIPTKKEHPTQEQAPRKGGWHHLFITCRLSSGKDWRRCKFTSLIIASACFSASLVHSNPPNELRSSVFCSFHDLRVLYSFEDMDRSGFVTFQDFCRLAFPEEVRFCTTQRHGILTSLFRRIVSAIMLCFFLSDGKARPGTSRSRVQTSCWIEVYLLPWNTKLAPHFCLLEEARVCSANVFFSRRHFCQSVILLGFVGLVVCDCPSYRSARSAIQCSYHFHMLHIFLT